MGAAWSSVSACSLQAVGRAPGLTAQCTNTGLRARALHAGCAACPGAEWDPGDASAGQPALQNSSRSGVSTLWKNWDANPVDMPGGMGDSCIRVSGPGRVLLTWPQSQDHQFWVLFPVAPGFSGQAGKVQPCYPEKVLGVYLGHKFLPLL